MNYGSVVARAHRCRPGDVHGGRNCCWSVGDRYFENGNRRGFSGSCCTVAATTVITPHGLLLLRSAGLCPRGRGFPILGSAAAADAGQRRWQSSRHCLCIHLLLPFQRMRLGVLSQVILPVEPLAALAAYLKQKR